MFHLCWRTMWGPADVTLAQMPALAFPPHLPISGLSVPVRVAYDLQMQVSAVLLATYIAACL